MNTLKDSKSYKRFALEDYLSYKKIQNPDVLLKGRRFKIEDDIKEYLGHLRSEGFSWSAANIAKSALVLFYDSNRVDLNSESIRRSLGEHTYLLRTI